MTKLDQISENELKPKFLEAAQKFVAFVMDNAKPKEIKGSPLNGKSFALMFETFLESVNKKNISIRSTYQIVANEGNRLALELGKKTFNETIAISKLPLGSSKLNELTKRASETATKAFLSSCIDIESNLSFSKELNEFLENEIEKIEKENLKASAEKCLKFLESLYAPIEDKSNNGNYLVDGGYDELKKDVESLKLEYLMECSKHEEFGPSKLEVLTKFERQKVMLTYHFQLNVNKIWGW